MLQRSLPDLLVEKVEEIEAGVAAFAAGRASAYQTVAIQLRSLLLDTDPRSGPLLMRVLPNALFHQLADRSFPERDALLDRAPSPNGKRRVQLWEFNPRGYLRLGGPLPLIVLEVDRNVLIPVDRWLDDWIITRDFKIRDLIAQVANKDVAHVDAERGPMVAALEANQALVRNGHQQEAVRPVIIGIGQYVAVRARELLEDRG